MTRLHSAQLCSAGCSEHFSNTGDAERLLVEKLCNNLRNTVERCFFVLFFSFHINLKMEIICQYWYIGKKLLSANISVWLNVVCSSRIHNWNDNDSF